MGGDVEVPVVSTRTPGGGAQVDGDVGALISLHLPLVRHIVFQVAVHFPRHVDREELTRAGALGLVEAAHRYVGARGVPFNRFAAQRIRGAILDTLRSSDWAPRSVRNVARAIEQATARLTSERGRPPTHGELADAVGLAAGDLTRLQARIERATLLALDHPVGEVDDEIVTLADTIHGDGPELSEVLERRELRAYLRAAVRHLPERHRIVVVGYFLEGRTSVELAALLGVTESRVSQIRSEALRLLREVITAQYASDGSHPEPEPGPGDRHAHRRNEMAVAVAAAASWRERLETSLPL